MPKFTIQIASKPKDSKPYPVPVLAASISDGLDSCILTYGNFLKPIFENLVSITTEQKYCDMINAL